MSDAQQSLAAVEPEILVASCTSSGKLLYRNEAWQRVLGDTFGLWNNLLEDDQDIARQNLKEAARGSLVTNAVFMFRRADRDLPLPVLLHFIPIPPPSSDSGKRTHLVVITGEV
ncbi:MAG: hypothetical protein O6942_00610, partial [Bacteroidetes bacterium]|nr:hypothetical protein [Bacteroidota bacterium]